MNANRLFSFDHPVNADAELNDSWVDNAIRAIRAETTRSSDTHLLKFPLPEEWNIDLYLKDESTHITGSLKHRLARSLFLYALCNGCLGPNTTVVEASSGSTAVSEAYFAGLIGLRFIAVIPEGTSSEKISLIESFGGTCHSVADAGHVYAAAKGLVEEIGDAYYMDQFTYAERATDWRGNNNIAEATFEQMKDERFPVPAWVVCAAGTGGTSTTYGRFIKYKSLATKMCVPDPEGSVFFDAWKSLDRTLSAAGSQIEGIGRPRVEPSFMPHVIDQMLTVTNEESVAAMQVACDVLGKTVGPSTGTNLWASLALVDEMRRANEEGSIVTVLCDSGDRYHDTYYDEEWLASKGWRDAIERERAALEEFLTPSH